MKRIFPILGIVFFLWGCGAYTVRVPHLMPRSEAERAYCQALGAVYLVVEKPDLRYDTDTALLASEIGTALEERGATLLAYQVVESPEEALPYIEKFKPQGVLTVTVPSVGVDRRSRLKAVTTGFDDDKSTNTVSVWDYTTSLQLKGSLASQPQGTKLAHFSDRVIQTEESGEPKEWEEWYGKVEGKLLRQAARSFVSQAVTSGVVRNRTLYYDSKDKTSVKAYQSAKKGDWDSARTLWSQRRDSRTGDWRDTFDLAVAAEERRDYEQAKLLYAEARASSGPAGRGIPWESILADLSGTITPPPLSEGLTHWFSGRLAVLPFADETTSIDGPILIRQLCAKILSKAGYNVIPLEEVDRILSSRGYSDGAQLAKADPKDVAQWLKAERLLFGDIEEFNEVPLGVYHKRVVAGKMTLWDADTQNVLFTTDERTLTQYVMDPKDMDKGKKILARFGWQLAGGLFERLIRSPLGPETQIFVRRSLRRLPMRATRR